VALIYFVMRLLRQLQAVGSAPPIDYAYLRSVPGTSCTPANPEVGGAVLRTETAVFSERVRLARLRERRRPVDDRVGDRLLEV
jgi:hypothetical protein